jgi:hypothetical protein
MNTENNIVKPQFSGHETFPLRQLWLSKAYNASVRASESGKSPFGDDGIVNFGVGKNMVASIKHWAIACKIIDDSQYHLPTKLGHDLFGTEGLDPFGESPATAWLIHWILASTIEKSTTWYLLFNHLTSQTFDRENINVAIFQQISERFSGQGFKSISPSTIKRDVECCIRSYVPHLGGDSTEEISEPLLGELGIIQQHNKNTFEFRRGAKKSLPDGIFIYALLDYWQRQHSSSVMAFDRIAHGYGSPGRVFKLDEDAVAERLMSLEDITLGEIQWTEQAGIRQVVRRGNSLYEVQNSMSESLRKAYVY